jgi:hypothetical protein
VPDPAPILDLDVQGEPDLDLVAELLVLLTEDEET